MRYASVLLVMTVLALGAGCSGGGSAPSATATAADGATTVVTARATGTSFALEAGPAVSVTSAAERDRIIAALAGLPTGIEVSNHELAGGTRVVRAWAVVTDQHRDVLDLSMHDLLRVLDGEVDNWAAVGGSPLPIAVELPTSDAADVEALTGAPLLARAARKPLAGVLADLEAKPGTLALVPVEALRIGVLALVLDGYDPYRDPAAKPPLKIERWVKARDAATTAEAVRRLGWDTATPGFDPVGVLATGDFIPARCTWSSMVAGGGPLTTFNGPGLRELLRGADLTVVALEVGLMTSNPPTPCVSTTVLQGPADAVNALVDGGVDIVTRASSHAFDCWSGCSGITVMQETNAVLKAAGIPWTGVGNDAAEARTATVVERGGVRFALLAYDDIAPWYHAEPGGAGTAGLDLATLGDDVRAAKARADHVFVSFHWGIEYQAEPTDRQREAAHIAIEAGATLVIGNHPHWVQATERIGNGFAEYALGNFVFDQPWSVPTQQGMGLIRFGGHSR